MSDRLVLAFDTSFGPVSAALATYQGQVIASDCADNVVGKQAETLPPLVARLLANAGVAFSRVGRIVVTVGPGAFTGVRVGLAFAKGLHLSTGAEILGVSTLECVALQAQEAFPGLGVATLFDAKRGEVYALALNGAGDVLLPAALLSVEQAQSEIARVFQGPFLLTGSGGALVSGAFQTSTYVEMTSIDARALASRGGAMCVDNYVPLPAYLRAPDARLPA